MFIPFVLPIVIKTTEEKKVKRNCESVENGYFSFIIQTNRND